MRTTRRPRRPRGTQIVFGAVTIAALLSSGCGEFVRQSQSPSQLVMDSILTTNGLTGVVVPGGPLAPPGVFGTFLPGPLQSDVPDLSKSETVFADYGQATLRVILRDPGAPGSPTAPSSLNDVTITRYTVTYLRSGGPNGRNTPGIDVPRPIDVAATFTVGVDQSVATVIELVRQVAKVEAPLAALGSGNEVLTMIAEVTFYGRDQAGNELSVSGSVQVNFANFN